MSVNTRSLPSDFIRIITGAKPLMLIDGLNYPKLPLGKRVKTTLLASYDSMLLYYLK